MRNILQRLAVFMTVTLAAIAFAGCGGKKETIILEEDSTTALTAQNAEDQAAEPLPAQKETTVVLYVHVCGAVEREGVYALGEEARIADAVVSAGGAKEDADTAAINLAERVSDGMKVYVPFAHETEGLAKGSYAAGATGSFADAGSGKININTATAEELKRLNGIGERYAALIIAYREANGAFSSIEDIKKVHGIGEKTFAKIQDMIIV